MQIFNTLTRQKEEFVPQVPGEYRIYVCGPTVYNYIHIGNARPLIVFDTLRRYLEYRGNKVFYVSNITDIDDKLIKKGQEEGTSMKEVAQRFEAAAFGSRATTAAAAAGRTILSLKPAKPMYSMLNSKTAATGSISRFTMMSSTL